MTALPTAVVTGAASGIGAATVERLLRHGTVIGVDVAQQPPETDLPRGGGKLYWVQGDVSEPGTWERVQNLARSDLEGAVTVLVSCAMQHAMGDILTLSDADWASVFRSTFYGAVLAIRSCLPTMIEVGGGSIVTVGSVSGQFAEQGLVAYGAAKAALIQLTRSVAVDFARKGVRANCVCPGTTDTPSFRRHLDTAARPDVFLAARVDRNPIGRILTPDEVAAAIEYLAFEDASAITGAVVAVDGGLTSCFEYRD